MVDRQAFFSGTHEDRGKSKKDLRPVSSESSLLGAEAETFRNTTTLNNALSKLNTQTRVPKLHHAAEKEN